MGYQKTMSDRGIYLAIIAVLSFSACTSVPKNGPLAARFYEGMGNELVWSESNGPLPRARSLVDKVKDSPEEGLRSDYYNLGEIEEILDEARARELEGKGPPGRRKLLKLDRLLTKAFLIYGGNLLYGHVDPLDLEGESGTTREQTDLVEILGNAIDTDLVVESLDWLLPRHPGYSRLKMILKEYKEISARGGWPQVPMGINLKTGDRGEQVAALKERLYVTGDLKKADSGDRDLFDEDLEKAVRRFQSRHGLDVTGEVDPLTFSDLNMPVEARIRQIEVNLERWRWLARDFGQRYVMVDIAGFRLMIYEGNDAVLMMPIIVGQPSWKTPTFSGTITYLVLNPVWRIPKEIVLEEFVPKILENPDYLSELGVNIYKGLTVIDPATVDWRELDKEKMDFWLVQESCPENPLGRVKFMFPNKFEVYLHDTPQRELFTASFRAFSHGCVRIEKPFELMDYLLKDTDQCSEGFSEADERPSFQTDLPEMLRRANIDPSQTVEEYFERDCLNWKHLNVISSLRTGLEQYIVLPEPVNVHLTYLTSWVDERGVVHFRTDVYGNDRSVDQALGKGLQ
jgi:murein L,D-transpeptidase YcbB/YkuD